MCSTRLRSRNTPRRSGRVKYGAVPADRGNPGSIPRPQRGGEAAAAGRLKSAAGPADSLREAVPLGAARREDTEVLSTASRIIDLVDQLAAVPPDRIGDDAFASLLLDATVDASSLEPYLYWSPRRYTRNLLFRTNEFELLALCWDEGSRSPIHDHDGQRCYMKAITGAFEVEDFSRAEGGREPGSVRLNPLGTRTLVAGELDSLDTSRDIHRVAPLGGRAISLHVYTRPLDRAMIYDLEKGACRYAYLRYDAIRADAFQQRAIA